MFGGYHANMVGLNLCLQRALHDEMDDDFLMYTYKVRRCSKTKSHDWTDCPYAHRGEKARRRDPRKFPYTGVACPEFRNSGECRRGQNCEYAHGVFEFWLHPSRYRTRACEAGLLCPRRICFFAHTPEQLRPDVIKDCYGRGGGSCGGQLVKVSTKASASNGGAGVGLPELEQLDEPDIEWIMELVD